MKVASLNQMREMDRKTIKEFQIPALLLMENAAIRFVDILQERFQPLHNKTIAVVVGKGNNGGDGLAIARHLVNRFSAKVTVWLLAGEEHLKDEVLLQFKMARACGVELKPASEIDLSQVSLVVDALFGTGIKGPVKGEAAKIIEEMNSSGKPVIAVDVPSGLETDTGKAEGSVVQAHLTVTFASAKYGLMVYPGAALAGEVMVVDIGTPPGAINDSAIQVFSTEESDISSWLPKRPEGRDINKGTFGHVIVFAGSTGFGGAPVLVSEAAVRTGAGLVTLCVPENLRQSVVSRVSPVVMASSLSKSQEDTFTNAEIEPALKLLVKAKACAIGPGLGTDDHVAVFVREFITRCQVPLVIDADALNVLAKEPGRGIELIKRRKAATILTPHPGEMARLLNITTNEVQSDRKSAVMKAVETYKCVVLLKGARTLIVSPEGKMHINTNGNAGMASGGSGDVLTGVVAALLAQGLRPEIAATTGAYIHGLAGDLAAAELGGTTGLNATDIISMLPKAIARCQHSARAIQG